jgi:hypothetical protein
MEVRDERAGFPSARRMSAPAARGLAEPTGKTSALLMPAGFVVGRKRGFHSDDHPYHTGKT